MLQKVKNAMIQKDKATRVTFSFEWLVSVTFVVSTSLFRAFVAQE